MLDTSTFIADCHWNHDGSILAIIGSTVLTGENKESSVIQFFSPFGKVTIIFNVIYCAF